MKLFHSVSVYLLTYITVPAGATVLYCVSTFADIVPIPEDEAVLQCISIFADPYNSPSRCNCFTVCQYICWPTTNSSSVTVASIYAELCNSPSRWNCFTMYRHICCPVLTVPVGDTFIMCQHICLYQSPSMWGCLTVCCRILAGLPDSTCRLAYFTAWIAMFTSLTNSLSMRPFRCVSGTINIFTALPTQSL